MNSLELQVKEALTPVLYQENKNIIDAEIIHSLEIKGDLANVILLFSDTDHQDLQNQISAQVKKNLLDIESIENVRVRCVDSLEKLKAMPGQQQKAVQSPQNKTLLQNYKHIILVASGKGGVGKSTVSANLALGLQKIGKAVSLFDADIYGPSIPLMFDIQKSKPEVIGQQVLPLSQFGIELLSIGNLVESTESIVWRGPMVHNALIQLLRDTAWPGGDYMIIDLPPGTGDVQISLSQSLTVSGSLIVCTPQDVALIDARKAIAMFQKVNIPILGMIENMSSFICPSCNTETPIFSSGGVEKESKHQNTNFIGKIPIDLQVRLGGDKGAPIVYSSPDHAVSKNFIAISENIVELLP